MGLGFSLPLGLKLLALLLGVLLGSILPTCLYLYVEPRGRHAWAARGDTLASRRAPLRVRATAWLGFAIAQAALPLLLVPVVCGALLYVQIRLGAIAPIDLGVTALLGVAALFEAIGSVGLVAHGVRLLAGDSTERDRAVSRARVRSLVHGSILAVAVLLGFAMSGIPHFVRPVLRATLEWTALRPIIGFAAMGLVHAVMLDRCGRMLAKK